MSLVSFPSWGLTWDDLVTRDGLHYKKFTDLPFTGKMEGRSNGSFKNGMREGLWVIYHKNGQLGSKGDFKNDKHEGFWEYYYPSGQLSRKGNYRNGIQAGYWESYWDNGQLISKGDYKNGREEGYWVHYNEDGSVDKKYSGTFKDGVKVSD